MKPVFYAVSALVVLCLAGNPARAYSGSECEVNDCSKPGPASAGAKGAAAQPKTKAEVKAQVKSQVKEEAKTQAKDRLLESAPSPLRDAAGFFK